MANSNYPKYTDEFKNSIVTLHQNGKSLSQLSKEYGISMSALSKWVRNLSEVKIDEDTVVTAQQIKELQKRNAMLEEENLILKKSDCTQPSVANATKHSGVSSLHTQTEIDRRSPTSLSTPAQSSLQGTPR